MNPSGVRFAEFIRTNATLCCGVVQRNGAIGRDLILCGAGPSLAETAPEFCAQGDADVWACNGALPWLIDNGFRVTHGFTVNSLDAELWPSAPDVGYLLSSTVIPSLAARLLLARRRVTWFHNFVDLPEQDALYAELYPPTVCAGAGLNAVTRALDVATFMGYDCVTVLGADCCLRGEIMHVDGSTAAASGCSDVMLSGEIDGRTWTGQADLWVSANWLTRISRASNGKVRLVGNTLPNALASKDVTFLDRLPHSVDTKGNRIPILF